MNDQFDGITLELQFVDAAGRPLPGLAVAQEPPTQLFRTANGPAARNPSPDRIRHTDAEGRLRVWLPRGDQRNLILPPPWRFRHAVPDEKGWSPRTLSVGVLPWFPMWAEDDPLDPARAWARQRETLRVACEWQRQLSPGTKPFALTEGPLTVCRRMALRVPLAAREPESMARLW